MAKKLEKLGCRLILWDCDAEGLESLKNRLNPTVLHVYQVVDVGDAEQIETQFSKSPVQDVDIVIANAGVVIGKSCEGMSIEDFERTTYVNLFQHFYLFKSVVSKLKNSAHAIPPTFVMVSSVCGLMALTNLADYCASKFGVVGFAEGLRLDLRRAKSPVNTLLVMPFIINTKMFNGVSIKPPASWLLKRLNKKETAEKIVEGIRAKKQWLVMPWILHFAPIMLILPIFIRNLLYDLIGEATYMDSYKAVDRVREARKMPSILTAPLPEEPIRKLR